jgi:hypothetical protein
MPQRFQVHGNSLSSTAKNAKDAKRTRFSRFSRLSRFLLSGAASLRQEKIVHDRFYEKVSPATFLTKKSPPRESKDSKRVSVPEKSPTPGRPPTPHSKEVCDAKTEGFHSA